ncbi:MAG: hypothetical protein ACJASB_003655, partial [Shewanella psychromarinicola]|uniref:hypothetical protein n=1 Tax=Shewanella psychromarinicola TaxID=2487742 RepID=UPI003EEF82B5
MKNPAKLFPLNLMNKSLAIAWGNAANSTRPWTMACLLLATSPVFAGVQTQGNTETITYKANEYTVKDASLWSDDGPGSLQVDWSLSEQQWDKIFGRPPRARISVGGIDDECILGVCVKVGAEAGLEFEAYVLPYLKADVNPGTFDALAVYQPTVKYQFSGLGVDFFDLDTDDGFNASASQFIVHAPSIKLETGLNISADLNLFAEACLLGCFLDKTYNLASVDFKLPLLEIDTLNSTAKVFSPPTNVIQLVEVMTDLAENPPNSLEDLAGSVLYDDVSAVLGRVSETQWNNYKNELQKEADAGNTSSKDKLNNIETAEGFIAASPVSLEFSNPYTSDAEGEWGGTSNNIATATIGGDFLDLRLDVDKVIGYALGLPNGASLSLKDFGIKKSPIDVEVTLFDIHAGPSINLETELALSPELMVNFEFSAPVLIKGEIGAQTHYQGTWENIPDIALLAPSSSKNVGEYNNTDEVTATPTFFVKANISNRTYIDIAAALEIEGPSATVGIDGFGSLNIESPFQYAVESDSIAQIDIYNETFSTGTYNETFNTETWDSATEAERNKGASRIGEAGDTSGLGASESLSFDPSGEIVFQARSNTRDDDLAKGDARVQQFLNTNALINADIAMRGYEDTAWEDLDINVNRLFDFKEPYGLVRFNIEDRFKIDVGQLGQVMTDGQFKASKGDFFTVERGGTLELGATNPYGSAVGGNNGSQGEYGFINDGATLIEGDMYMANDALAGGDPNRYKFTNNGGGANVTVGSQGKVKFDGTFENKSKASGTGFVNNSGNFELTADNNTSSGIFRNFYGAELDLFGKLSVYETSSNSVSSFRDLYNNGEITLYSGAQLDLRGGEKLTYFEQASDFVNNGELIIHKGAEFKLSANDGDVVLTRPQSQSVDKAILENLHIVKNEGVIRNETGQLIINGKEGSDWQAYRESGDALAYAKQLRDNALTDKPADYSAASKLALSAADETSMARGDFISEAQGFINDGKTYVELHTTSAKLGWQSLQTNKTNAYNERELAKEVYEEKLNLFGTDYLATFFPFYLADYKNKSDIYETYFYAEETTRGVLEVTVNSFTSLYQANNSSVMRNAENDYKLALTGLQTASINETKLRKAIDDIIDAGTGLGVMVNDKGGLILNSGELVNNAVLVNSASGAIYNDTDAKLNNAGGYLQNSGLLVNQKDAQLTNTGVIDNGMSFLRKAAGILGISELINLGQLNNQGEIINNDTLINYGDMNNQSDSNTATEALIVNSGIMSNLGQINNDAQLDNYAGSEINNHSKIVNNGTITNDGVFNNGQNSYASTGSVFNVGDVVSDANSFYRSKQTIRGLDNELSLLDEKIKDSRAREGTVTLQQNPLLPLRSTDTGNDIQNIANQIANISVSLVNRVISQQNLILNIAYEASLADAKGKTQVIVNNRSDKYLEQVNAQNNIESLASIGQKYYTDANGNRIAGSFFVNLAAIASANTAELENNGTFNNRGLFNNIATVNNNESGVIRNSGILMNGEQGTISNAGQLQIEQATIEVSSAQGANYSFEQSGILISNGIINNTGTIEVTGGSLINGTVEDGIAQINNSGQINLSAIVTESPLPDNANVMMVNIQTSTNLINQGAINNQAGGSINIGAKDSVAAKYGLYSEDTLVNIGNITNQKGASINNYGMLVNAGLIDNKSESSFINQGILNNTDTGEINFVDATALGGYVVNNGLITMTDNELLTLTGNISGNGTFAGNTLIQGSVDAQGKYTATVNPGNSPGLLTFDGNVEANNVNWVM